MTVEFKYCMIITLIFLYLGVGFIVASLVYRYNNSPDMSFIMTMLTYPIFFLIWFVLAIIDKIIDMYKRYLDWLRKGEDNNSGTGDLW